MMLYLVVNDPRRSREPLFSRVKESSTPCTA